MAVGRGLWFSNLRLKCFLIGYMNLISSVVDIGFHIAIVAIVSNGFQCDVTEESLASVDWPWLEPFLLAINLGTHGFYPFPLVLGSRNSLLDYFPTPARCYPGVLHVHLIDILNLTINVIWLRFVKAYVVALHQKDPEPMRLFFGLSLVKMVLQIMYFSYQPEFRIGSTNEVYWFLKLFDITLSALFLLVIYEYIKELRQEKSVVQPQSVDQPPPYIECLITAPTHNTNANQEGNKVTDGKKDTEVSIPEEKKVEETKEGVRT